MDQFSTPLTGGINATSSSSVRKKKTKFEIGPESTKMGIDRTNPEPNIKFLFLIKIDPSQHYFSMGSLVAQNPGVRLYLKQAPIQFLLILYVN